MLDTDFFTVGQQQVRSLHKEQVRALICSHSEVLSVYLNCLTSPRNVIRTMCRQIPAKQEQILQLMKELYRSSHPLDNPTTFQPSCIEGIEQGRRY